MFGKDIPTATTLNETVVHQISEMSSRVVLECTFSNDKKKRDRKSKESKKSSQNQTGNKKKLILDGNGQSDSKSFHSSLKARTSSECEYEMKIILCPSRKSNEDKISETKDLE